MSHPQDIARLVHDLRNPLNSITMTAELAKLQLQQGAGAASVAENLDAIVRICRQCSDRLEAFSSTSSSDGAPSGNEGSGR